VKRIIGIDPAWGITKRLDIRRSPRTREETIEMRSPHSIVAGLLTGVLAALLFAGAASALEVGQKAPDFTLNGTDGKPVKLSDLTAKGPIVLYTFIAAFTGT
jgi:AhpC/TSA family